jgi:eukaryotic-like serine/threonine-protein kinase
VGCQALEPGAAYDQLLGDRAAPSAAARSAATEASGPGAREYGSTLDDSIAFPLNPLKRFMSNERPPDPAAEPLAGKVCPTCGAEYAADALFCLRDASSLVPNAPHLDLVGQVIADRYHILRRLGEGGMARVYLAEHVTMGRVCAIKVMHPSLRSDPEAVGRFRREAANAGRINHPNVAAIHDCGETGDRLVYLAMEYVPGDSLAAILKWESPIAPRRAVSIALQAANGLGAAHDLGIIHRDLTPENIMVSRSPDGDDLVKVVDFGIAKAAEGHAQTVTRAGFVVGTIQYMSPEQMMGEMVDARSDLYSLGCVLYEMIVGKRLFEGATGEALITKRLTEVPPRARELDPRVPAAVDAVVMKLLSRAPADRYQSAEEVQEALASLVIEPSLPRGRRLVTPWRRSGGEVAQVDTPAPPAAVPAGAASPYPDREPREPAPTMAARPRGARWLWLGVGAVATALVAALSVTAGGRSDAPRPAATATVPEELGAAGLGAVADRPAAHLAISEPAEPPTQAQPTTGEGPAAAPAPVAAPAPPQRVAAQGMPPTQASTTPRSRVSVAEVEAVRTLVAAAEASSREMDFEDAFRSLSGAERRIDALRTAHPDADEPRALAREHQAAFEAVRGACAQLVEVRRSLGREPPRCTYS